MNHGLNSELIAYLNTYEQGLKVIHRPLVKQLDILNPNWVARFTSGDGGFYVKILKDSSVNQGHRVRVSFNISQHSRDRHLLNQLISFFDCGSVYDNNDMISFNVYGLRDIYEKIVPFFNQYSVRGIKYLNYYDFCEVVKMMKIKSHLTKEGLLKIKRIAQGMNTGRSR
jgi:LAGLIDADG endonuclease